MVDIIYSHQAATQGVTKIIRLLVHWKLHKLSHEHHTKFPQMAIFSHDHIGHVVNVDGRYEDDYLKAVFGWLGSFMNGMGSKIALDIGANIGNHTVFFAEYFKEVHAFEPNPRTFELLNFNAAQASNITTHCIGFSDTDNVGTLHENPTNIGGTYIEVESGPAISSSKSVMLSTLDKFVTIHGLKNIGLIKIDTEGFEARILNGAHQAILANRPVILFELSPSDFDRSGSSDVVTILDGLGYRFASVDKNFQMGKSRLGRYISFFMRTVFGEKYLLKNIIEFDQKYYQMVVAIPNEIST